LTSENIFRAYDIRGVFNEDLNTADAVGIAETFAAYLDGKGPVSVARDGRTSSPAIENAVAAGLSAGGVDVEAFGLLPIPTANFATWQGAYTAGVYVTASHNPPKYNGVRFRHPDGAGFTLENEEVKRMYFAGKRRRAAWDALGKVKEGDAPHIVDRYTHYLLKRLPGMRSLKVVLDPGNGAAAVTAPRLFTEAGFQVRVINGEVDGTFPDRDPHPTEKTIGSLRKAVKKHGAAFGVAFDGDGDRCVFADDKGRAVQTDKVGIIVAREVARRKRGGTVLANVPCSMIVEEELEKIPGTRVQRVRVGDVFVCEAIRKHNAIFAMEISSHYFLPEFYIFDDPVLMALKLAQEVGESGRKLSQMADDIPSYPFVEKGIAVADELKFDAVKWLVKQYRAEGLEVQTTDGAKVDFEDGWGLLRASNTQPMVRLFAEAKTKEALKAIVKRLEKDCAKAVRRASKKAAATNPG
jgi:phosphomannomutase/phosphoglucomutase